MKFYQLSQKTKSQIKKQNLIYSSSRENGLAEEIEENILFDKLKNELENANFFSKINKN